MSPLCALVWAWVPTGEEVSEQMPNAAVSAETAAAESAPETTLSSDDEPVRITMQSEPNEDPENLTAEEEAAAMTITETEPIPAAAVEPPVIVSLQGLMSAAEPQSEAVCADPYHTTSTPKNSPTMRTATSLAKPSPALVSSDRTRSGSMVDMPGYKPNAMPPADLIDGA